MPQTTWSAPPPWMTDQVWSYIVLVTGCVMIVICRHLGVTEDVGAGIVGAGIQAFTAQQRGTVTTTSSLPVPIAPKES